MSIKKINYFKIDKKRNLLALQNKTVELKESYKTAKIENPNTSAFWNQHIDRASSFNFLDGMTKDRIKTAAKFVRRKSRKFLDIGLGYGFFEKEMKKKKRDIKFYGIDISKNAINTIKKSVKGIFKEGSILKIPFNKKSFDTVVALEVLEHIMANETFSAYKEIIRVLKKDGQFIASVPIYETYTPESNPNRHLRSYTPKLFIEELKLAGFKIVKIKKLYAFSKFYNLKNFLKIILRKRWKPNIIIVDCLLKN